MSPRNPGQAPPRIDILQEKRAVFLGINHTIGASERAWARRQRHRLAAGQGRVRDQQFAMALEVHPINSEPGIPSPSFRLIPTQGGVGHQTFFLVQGIGVLPKLSHLPK